MKKIICSIIALLCCSQFVMLADDCSDALSEAKSLYNNGNYAKAKSLFEYVKSECGSSYGDATNWIAKCNDALTPKLSLSRTSISVGASSGSTSITVTSNRTWELRNTSSSMFSVSKSGNTITIQYYSNSSTSSRNDYFDVATTDGTKSVRVSIYQSGTTASPSLSVSKTSISAGASGITEYITVTCNTTWEVQYPSGTMYSVTRNGNSLTVKILPNSSTESRSDYFNVKTTDGSKVQKIQLTQGGASTLSVSKTSVSCSASGTTEYITVTSGKSWEVQYPSGTMYSVTRSGNTLTVKILPNSSTESRSDYFNVKTTDGSKVIKVQLSQTGKTIDNSALTYTHSGGNVYKLIGTTRTYTDNATALSHLTENIKKWEQCRTGAITSVGKGVAIYGNNGYASTGIPNDLLEKIKYANDNSLRIHDVCMSANGTYWCIVYGSGGWQSWAPTSFNEKMKACHSASEKIVSISITNSGEWVIITDKHLYASSTTFQNKLSEVSDLFGYIYSVALTDKGYVICADRGLYYNNIPTKVLEKIKEKASTKIIKVLKFTDDGTVFLTDGESSYSYYM